MESGEDHVVTVPAGLRGVRLLMWWTVLVLAFPFVLLWLLGGRRPLGTFTEAFMGFTFFAALLGLIFGPLILFLHHVHHRGAGIPILVSGVVCLAAFIVAFHNYNPSAVKR